MNSTLKFALILSALSLGAAQAATATSTGSAAAYASVAAQADVRTAVLLDAAGRVVGTVDASGRVVARGAVETATKVRVTFEGGATQTLDLATRVRGGAQATAETVIVKSASGSASLGAWVEARAETTTRATTNAGALLRGKTVVLVDATGNAVGSFGTDGRLRATGDVSAATDVLVTLESGTEYSFELATDAMTRASGMLKVETVNVQGTAQNVALASVLARIDAGIDVTTDAEARTDKGTDGASSGAGASAGGSTTVRTGVGISVGTGGAVNGDTETSDDSDTTGEGETSGGISIGVGGGIGIGIGGGR